MKNIMIAAVYLLLLFAMRVGAEAVADELMSILLLMGVIFLMGPGIIFGLYELFSGRLQPTRPALLCRAMPLALILTGMALVIAIPFTQIFAENRHERVKAQRMQVVSAIERQALMPDEQGRVHLPEKWRALSRFDEAMVYELSPQRDWILGVKGSARFRSDGNLLLGCAAAGQTDASGRANQHMQSPGRGLVLCGI